MRTVNLIILLTFTTTLFACGGYYAESNANNTNQANSDQVNLTYDSNIDSNINLEANANADLQDAVPVKRPVPAKPDPLVRPAPDDSEITAENNPEGDLVETRIFKNHDMIAKVERILTASRSNGRVRVFLKNGRVYEVPVSKLKNALKESPDEIIKAVSGDVTTTAAQAANRAQIDARGGSGANTSSANTGATPQKQ
jgi:hypothetical protein